MQDDKDLNTDKNVFEKMGLVTPFNDEDAQPNTVTTQEPEWMDETLTDAEPVEAMNLMQCMTGVFISPVKTFRSLTAKTHILWPLVIIFVLTLVTTLLSMDAMESFTRMSMEAALAKNPQSIPPEMIESQLQMSMKLILFITPVMALLTPLIKGLITQGMAQLFGGKGNMKMSLSIIALSYMIAIAGGLIRLPIMMASGSIVTFSPALLLGPDQLGSAWSSFLMNFDLFTLWYLGVSAIGVREVHRISTGKAVVTVVIPFCLVLLMSLSGVIMEKLM